MTNWGSKEYEGLGLLSCFRVPSVLVVKQSRNVCVEPVLQNGVGFAEFVFDRERTDRTAELAQISFLFGT